MRAGVTIRGGRSVLLKGLAAPAAAGNGNNEGGLKANGKRTDFSPLNFGKCLYFICGGCDQFAKLIRSLLSTGVSIRHPGPFLWPQAADSTGQCVHPTPCSSPGIPPVCCHAYSGSTGQMWRGQCLEVAAKTLPFSRSDLA
ncbi:sodium/hydrogen exchanger 2-like [Platysternon megacephalum]|uniref:Sodium/hydrogen exchanger 2-like n=1 Tax=Platysternon megacephalum TaxID=55544 RepID=A0A4D9EV13_9SAUR|nr:sodium/hydrogen exchanger 2-like [Platysternon megacephalum]